MTVGVGEVLQIVLPSAEEAATPIIVTYGDMKLAVGRKRIASLPGRVRRLR